MKKVFIGVAGLALLVLLILKLTAFNVSNSSWVAEQIIDDGTDTLQIEVDKIRIEFEDERYTFHSTLNQKEIGTYVQKGKHLILTPEGSTPPYRIDILSESTNALVLKMMADQIPRQLHLRPI